MTNFVSLILFYFFHFWQNCKIRLSKGLCALCVTCERGVACQKKVDAERVGWTHMCATIRRGVSNFLQNDYENGIWQRVTHGSRWKEVHTDMNIYRSKHTDTIHPYYIVSSGTWHMSGMMALNLAGVETQAEQSNYKYKHLL